MAIHWTSTVKCICYSQFRIIRGKKNGALPVRVCVNHTSVTRLALRPMLCGQPMIVAGANTALKKEGQL